MRHDPRCMANDSDKEFAYCDYDCEWNNGYEAAIKDSMAIVEAAMRTFKENHETV